MCAQVLKIAEDDALLNAANARMVELERMLENQNQDKEELKTKLSETQGELLKEQEDLRIYRQQTESALDELSPSLSRALSLSLSLSLAGCCQYSGVGSRETT